ncbi:MAG: discoidin domain-containing protein [Lysobacter sp.]|nr:discoidin domain-containing protein [Lysobacter sp.]
MTAQWICASLLFLIVSISSPVFATPGALVIDKFDDISSWKVITSDQVTGKVRQAEGAEGKALCLDYDFNGVSGYVGVQRDEKIIYPADYAFEFKLRGKPPGNDLQFKLMDKSGDNVWWVNKPKYPFPDGWTPVRYKKRHIGKAWGPDPDPALKVTSKVEFIVYNSGVGGRGEVCFDELHFHELPAYPDPPPTPVATATSGDARLAVDGDPRTVWHADAGVQTLTLDLGRVREFGGLTLRWNDNEHASDYQVEVEQPRVSDDEIGINLRDVEAGNGGDDLLALPESEGRFVRIHLKDGPGKRYGLKEVVIEPLAFAAIPNDFIKALAKNARRGLYPRGFSGEQPYWTILGIDGGKEQGLIGEDGAIELGKGGVSVEPFVRVDDKLHTWADVDITQSLQDDYLPIPSVQWRAQDIALDITAFAQGTPDRTQLVARYRLRNPGSTPRDYTLVLAVRPLQVNPPSQFLNTIGGFSPIESLRIDNRTVEVNDKPRLRFATNPESAFVSALDAGMVVERLDTNTPDTSKQIEDATGHASGVVLYRMRLAPGESRDVAWMAPLTGDLAGFDEFVAATLQDSVSALWRDKLDRVGIRVPAQGKPLVDTLRTALAHMLISRTGPRLQPGTRSYSRAWIRDGAMIAEGLLRMGREDVAEEFLRWYAPFQFKNGKVPCCVDDRGSDPVPENDSHGELIFTIAEVYRYTGDKALLEKMWPHVQGAVAYMDELRMSERTEANRAKNAAFYGMMPASISHEGYSAKPMHSYWDNFWALRGYKDAVLIAGWLGKTDELKRYTAARDQFRSDLYASLLTATKQHGINFLPGAAELGDFDATSTTIALAPGGEQGLLPQDLLDNTFERYWKEFEQRRDGKRQWKDYTPYEWRNVGAFVRLGQRERAWQALQFFFDDREPANWNQWAEVVSRERRRPFFVGDLPHAWVASDFLRSVLDMFAYTRDIDSALVIAAGVPVDWFGGHGIAIDRLRTPYGLLGYSLRRQDGTLTLQLSDGMKLPPGGLVLPWPYEGVPGTARINGELAQWQDGELRIQTLPAEIQIDAQPPL